MLAVLKDPWPRLFGSLVGEQHPVSRPGRSVSADSTVGGDPEENEAWSDG